jgi:hypothetical protein
MLGIKGRKEKIILMVHHHLVPTKRRGIVSEGIRIGKTIAFVMNKMTRKKMLLT